MLNFAAALPFSSAMPHTHSKAQKHSVSGTVRLLPRMVEPVHKLVPDAPSSASDAAAIACALYHATLALLHASGDAAQHSHRLAGPLSQLVARQRTRIGQDDCARFAHALLAGDHEAALESCRRLIETAGEGD